LRNTLSKSLSTKIKIFQSALTLLNTKEIEAITIRDIAKEAGVSIGTFYYYYKTKFDVYNEAYKIQDDYFETTVSVNLPEGGTYEKLKYFFAEYSDYNVVRTPFKLYKLLVKFANPRYEKNYSYGMQRILNSIIRDGLQSGEIVSDETSNEITNFLLTCVRGCFRQWAVLDGSYDINEESRRFVDKLLIVYFPYRQLKM
jgi:AcrR family transcriptional regulator